MIKKVIGIVVALAAIAVIVVATLHSDKFSSLVFDEGEPAAAVEAAAEEPGVSMEEMVPTEEVNLWEKEQPVAKPDSAALVRRDSVSHPAR